MKKKEKYTLYATKKKKKKKIANIYITIIQTFTKYQ